MAPVNDRRGKCTAPSMHQFEISARNAKNDVTFWRENTKRGLTISLRKRITAVKLFGCVILCSFTLWVIGFSSDLFKWSRDYEYVTLLINSDEMQDDTFNGNDTSVNAPLDRSSLSSSDDVVHIAVVVCGWRYDEAVVMLKSALIFSHPYAHRLRISIFAERKLHESFKAELSSWDLRFDLYQLQFPDLEWLTMFKPCACQRLFIPYILNVTRLLYVDTDVIFLRPVIDLWRFFDRFKPVHVAGVAPEHEVAGKGWYTNCTKHPFYPPNGLNSGVFLMDLPRLRRSKWLLRMTRYLQSYREQIELGDQDLINIYFSFFPETVFLLPCSFNYRSDHCNFGSACASAEEGGVSVLHGNREVYHRDTEPMFKVIYEAIRDYKFGDDLRSALLDVIVTNLANLKLVRREGAGLCQQDVSHIFVKQLSEQIEKRERLT